MEEYLPAVLLCNKAGKGATGGINSESIKCLWAFIILASPPVTLVKDVPHYAHMSIVNTLNGYCMDT